MPWKFVSVVGQRWELVRLCLRRRRPSIAQLAARFGVSRSAAHKWVERFVREGAPGLRDRSRRPKRQPAKIHFSWALKIRKLRRVHPTWGPKKIRAIWRQSHRRSRLPSLRTIARWLGRLGLVDLPEKRRARPGPLLPARPFTPARRPNDVWTMDFKGWFRAGPDRVEPLTVRDLCTRYILGIFLLRNQSDAAVRARLRRLFGRWGLPRVIRTDNGAPFGGNGALGLSRLSVWWLSLGIEVEFSRPAHPEDNAGHEQMHRVYKAEAAQPPARDRARQQRRTERWRRRYNEERPHEAIKMKTPARLYRGSVRPLPPKPPEPKYDEAWEVRRVRNRGHIKWRGRQRFIGRAFVGQRIALKPLAPGRFEVFFLEHLIGLLHDEDTCGLRAAQRIFPKKKSPE
jgi:putative transposase